MESIACKQCIHDEQDEQLSMHESSFLAVPKMSWLNMVSTHLFNYVSVYGQRQIIYSEAKKVFDSVFDRIKKKNPENHIV